MKQFLILGTAQLGQPYGIANKSGQPDQTTATAIVQAALDGGVSTFDTAQGYGQSEIVLGSALKQLRAADKVKIISKLSPTLTLADAGRLSSSVRNSLDRLGVSMLYCCMFHREEHLSLLNEQIG
jgi:aryl-alcohol dehydrogenase-like predicted oxidoreductase